jgi:putative RecB family exonuclease
MNRPHFSYSQLSQYLRCPLQYYFERIVRLPRPFVSSSLVLGSSVHEALASYHTALSEHRTLSPHAIGDVLLGAWKRREQERPVQLRSDETASSLIDLGVSLVGVYLAQPPPENIIAVEQSIVVPLETSDGDYLDRPLVTVLDVLCRDGNRPKVIELKTSGRRYSQTDVDSSLQATCYVGAVEEYFGQAASLEYRVLVKTKTPQLQRLNRTADGADLTRVADIARTVNKAITAEAFYPNESPMNCSWCPYRGPCREWQGPAPTSSASSKPLSPVEVTAC